jgi:hypothetical protein
MPSPSADTVRLAYINWRRLGISTVLPLFALWRWLVNRRKADCEDNTYIPLRSPNSKFMGAPKQYLRLRAGYLQKDRQLPRYAKEDRFDIVIVLTVLP